MARKKEINTEMSTGEGWMRFERAVDAAVKSGPKHRTSKPQPIRQPLKASSFLFDGKSVEALKHSLKGFRDRGFDGSLVNCRLDVSKPVQRCPARLAGDDSIIGWAVDVDDNGRPALTAFDGDFCVVVAHG